MIYIAQFKHSRSITDTQHLSISVREEQLLHVLDHVLNEIYFFHDNSLKFIYVNNVAAENLGYSKGELRELTPLDLKRDFTYEYFDKLLEPLRKGDSELVEFSTFHYRKDGSCYPVEIQLRMTELDYTPIFMAVALDTTHRKLTEEDLQNTLNELAKLNSYETVINTVTLAVHKSIDLQTVMENSVEALSRHMEPVKNICIYLVEDGEAVMKSHRGYPAWFVNRVGRIPYPRGFTWKTIIEGKTLYVPDTDNDTVMGPAGKELGTKSYISIPIKKNDETVGAININSDKKNAFGPDELRILDIVSRQMEIAINNAGYAESLLSSEKALEEKVKQLSKKERYQKIINNVTQSVHSSIDLREVMENAVNALGHNIKHADLVQIHMVEGDEAVLKSHWGYPEWFIKRVKSIPHPKGLTWKTIIEGETLYVPDTDNDTVIGPAGKEVGIQCYVAMPINIGDETIGCLGINSFKKNVFDKEELILLGNIAKQIETAIMNAKHMEALKLSEERYQTLAEVLPIGVYRTDAEGKGIYVNDRLCNITGLTKEEACGDGWVERLHPDDRDYLISKWREAVSSGGTFIEEYRFVGSDGKPVWVLSEARPETRDDGTFKGFVGTITDITARKESEDKIRFQASLLDQVRNAVIATDFEGKIIYWNEFAEKLYQWKQDEVGGKSIIELIIPSESQEKARRVLKSIDETDHWHGIRMAKRKDGSTFPVEVILSVIRDHNENAIGSVGVSYDITERTAAEQKILEQAALLDITRDSILVRDLEQNIVYMNKSAEKLYGWKADEILGKNALDYFYRKSEMEQLEIPLDTLFEKGEWQGELQQVTRDGRDIIVDSRWTLIYDKENRPKSILSVNTDIADKKLLEERLLRTQRLESIGTLAGGIAHDLNNILQPIMMSIQLLRNERGEEAKNRMLDVLESNAQRGADLVKQVLSFTSGVQAEKQPLNVNYLISEIETIMKETFPKSIEILTDVGKDVLNISGNFTQLSQVLLNLCVNARDAMPEGGRLEVSAKNIRVDSRLAKRLADIEEGPYVVLAVSDTGSGITPTIREKIYDPFFTTKNPDKGTGLGLSTVWGIVKEHGGYIHLESEVGKGSKFMIYFPAVHTGKRTTSDSQDKDYAPSGKGETILVVDDEAAVLQITRLILEKFGYNVVTAANGMKAIEIFSGKMDEISVAIIDMIMPGIGGKVLAQSLKDISPSIKVIFASGYQKEENTDGFAKDFSDAFLHKPFNAQTLLWTVDQVINTKLQ